MNSHEEMQAFRGGLPNESDEGFFRETYRRAISTLDEKRRSFMERSRKAYGRITSSRAAQILRNLKIRRTDNFGTGLEELWTLDEFRQANRMTRRYIMAHTGIRRKFVRGECEGYGEDVTEHHHVMGDRLLDYRRVMDGVHVVNPDEMPYYKHYIDEDTADNRALTVNEQRKVLDIWKRLDAYIEAGGDDPTSQFNADLG